MSTLGRTMTWTSVRGASGRTTLTVTSRGGVTTLRLEESLAPAAGGLFGGIVGGVGGGFGIGLGVPLAIVASPLLGLGVIALGVGGSYALARSIFSSLHASRERQLRALADRLAERAAAALPAASPMR